MFRTQNHVLHVEALRNREVLSVETAAVIAGYTPFRLLRMLPPDKAPFRRGVVRIALGAVKCVHRQLAINVNGFFGFRSIEKQPASKPAHANLARLIEHGIRPHGREPSGNLGPSRLTEPIVV